MLLNRGDSMWQYNHTPDNDELYHYGVVGMKWGIKRAEKQGKKYSYKSVGQKWQKKKLKIAEKTGAKKYKIDKIKAKINQYETRDKDREKYAKQSKLSDAVLKGLLLGPVGSGTYNRMRSAGHGRIPSALLGNYVSSVIGVPVSKYLENQAARNKTKTTSKKKKVNQAKRDAKEFANNTGNAIKKGAASASDSIKSYVNKGKMYLKNKRADNYDVNKAISDAKAKARSEQQAAAQAKRKEEERKRRLKNITGR